MRRYRCAAGANAIRRTARTRALSIARADTLISRVLTKIHAPRPATHRSQQSRVLSIGRVCCCVFTRASFARNIYLRWTILTSFSASCARRSARQQKSLSAQNVKIGTSGDSQTSELRLFKREAERLMRGFVREREAEAVRLDEQLEAQELERGALAAKLFKPAGCKYTTPVEGTSLLERIGATSAQIRCLRAEERASVSKLAAARATLCSTVCDVLGERVVPELANDIGCLSAERFQEYQRALAHADDVLARRAQRKGEVLRRLARLRSTLSVDAAERTVETSIRAERSARAERRAVAEGIASRAFAGAVARAAFQSVPILTASADSGSEASAEWTAAPPAPAAPAAAAAERDTLGEDSEGDDGLGFAAATLDRIERCCVELEEEVRVRKEKLLPVGKEIAELWALLSTAEAERVAFKSEHKGLGLVAIDACDAKLAALRAEREERIAELCAARRNAILALWDVLLVRAPSREAASEERAARCVEESRTAPSVAVLGALGALRDALQPRAQCWQTHVVPHLGRWESALADRAALQQMQSDGGATALDFRGRKKFELYEKNLRRLPRIQRALRDGVAEFEAAVRRILILILILVLVLTLILILVLLLLLVRRLHI